VNTQTAINIIRPSLEELEPIIALFDAYRQFYRKESDLESASAFIRQRLEQQDSVIFLALSAEGKAMGFTQLYPFFSSLRMKKLWLLNDLFVYPEYRGMGISLQLIAQAKELALQTKAAGLSLETEKSNIVGNQLYPKTGFVLSEGSNFYSWDCPVS
jgi:GNAT superfamily N-acetyltransferase